MWRLHSGSRTLEIAARPECRSTVARMQFGDTSSAVQLLHKFMRDPADMATLRRILADGSARDVSRLANDEVVQRLAGRIRAGHSVVVSRLAPADRPAPVTQVGPLAREEADPELPPELATHWTEFRFLDSGGRPITGARYKLRLPDGSEVTTKLDGQGGTGRHKPQPEGRATIELAEIEEARWAAFEVDAHEPVALSIATRGLDSGERVAFEIFRLYRERPGEAVATLEADLDGSGAATVTWTPESIEAPNDHFIFRATVGGIWRKSRPISVHQHPISAEWSSDLARDGEEITLRACLRGICDGASATITILEKRWCEADDAEAQQLVATASGGVVEASWTIPAASVPRARGDTGRRDYYYSAEACGLHCTSGLLAVLPREEES